MQNSVPQRVCDTCAADGRDLQAIRSTPHYLYACKGLPVTKDDMICFECRATLRRIVRFKLRAMRVKTMLKHVSYNISKIQCLSTLIQTDISPKDILYVGRHHDHDGNLVQEKHEILGSGDVNEMADEIPRMLWSDENTVRIDTVDWMPESQRCSEYVTENIQQIFLTDVEVSKVPEALVEVKEETEDSEIVVTVEKHSEPLLVPKDDTLKERKISKNDPETQSRSKWVDNGDDSETDTASEAGAYEQTEPFCTAKKVNTAEVLSHMERLRGSVQYRCARYKCESCALVLHTEQCLRKHMVLHSETRGGYKCLICKQRFQTPSERQTHTSSHYCRFECRDCDRTEFSYRKIYQHFIRHHDTSPRFCRLCPARFTQLVELRKHRRTAHPTAPAHACDACDRRYPTPTLLQRHKRTAHTKVLRLECEICHKTYKGDFNLYKHMRDFHVKPQVKEPDENAYCAECDKQFPNVHLYRAHVKKARTHVARTDVNYECDDCGKTYLLKQSLLYHIENMHLRLSRYACDICDESFVNRNLRNTHRRRQHRAPEFRKTYACTVCGKVFRVHQGLKQHMNTHLGVRPYVCATCGATFPYKASLYTHNQLVHLKRKRGKTKR